MNQPSNIHIDRMKSDLVRLVSDAEDALRHTTDQTSERAAEWRSRMQNSVVEAKASLAKLPHEGSQKVREAGLAADAYVHGNPWKAIAATAALSALIGMLIARR